jgi:hypothetical protein
VNKAIASSTPLKLALILSNYKRPIASVGLLGSIAIPVFLCWPFLRAVYWFGDEGILLRGAAYMLSGKRLYIDLFEFYPPLSLLITQSWLYVFGQSFEAARWLAVTSIVGVSVFSYLACVVASENAVLSLMAVTAWLLASQGGLTVVNHHWFTTLFSMIAAWGLLSHISSRASMGWPLMSGLAAGAAAMTTPTRGALVVAAGLFVLLSGRAGRAQRFAYVLGVLTAPIACLGYVCFNGELGAAYQDIFIFPLTNYAGIQHIGFAYGVDLKSLDIVILFVVAAPIAALAFFRRSKGDEDSRRLLACALFGAGGFLGCVPRPDVAHILFVAPLLLPLAVSGAGRIAEGWDRKRWIAWGAIPILMGLLSAKVYLHDARQALAAPLTSTPAGPIAIVGDRDAGSQIVQAILRRPPTDTFLLYPYMPLMSFLVQRTQASKFDIFVPGYTPRAQYYEACVCSERTAKWLVIDKLWARPAHWKAIFPAMSDAAPPETRAFEAALDRDFAPAVEAGHFELRRRRPDANEAHCHDIALETPRRANGR